jgi:hypothetical protein
VTRGGRCSLEADGRKDLRRHDLRRTGAVLATQTGATLAELKERLGIRERRWARDGELTAILDAALGHGPAPMLRPLLVDLEELSMVLEGVASAWVGFARIPRPLGGSVCRGRLVPAIPPAPPRRYRDRAG